MVSLGVTGQPEEGAFVGAARRVDLAELHQCIAAIVSGVSLLLIATGQELGAIKRIERLLPQTEAIGGDATAEVTIKCIELTVDGKCALIVIFLQQRECFGLIPWCCFGLWAVDDER